MTQKKSSRGPLQRDFGKIKQALRNKASLKDLIGSKLSNPEGSSYPGFRGLVRDITDDFERAGFLPFRTHASYFSQNSAEDRCLQVSWIRSDLLGRASGKAPRTTASAGPAFRLSIYGDGFIYMEFSTKFSPVARETFRKNILADEGYLERAYARLRRGDRVMAKWGDDLDLGFRDFQHLAAVAAELKPREQTHRFCYFWITRPLRLEASAKILRRQILDLVKTTFPFFYGHLFPLTPKSAGTQALMNKQITREALRKQLMAIEKQCQNEDCPLPRRGHVHLETAHLKRGYNRLSNVVALCAHCHAIQSPRTSDLVLLGKGRSSGGKTVYRLGVKTREGQKIWRIRCANGHRLERVKV